MPYTDHFITVNKIKLHYIHYASKKKHAPYIILLHGLTANAHAFDGLIANGLTDQYQVVAPDFRGRGHSDKPAFQYGIKHHALDIIGLIDSLGLDSVILGGHSFGGLVSSYIAAYYPERVEKLIILDAAPEMNPRTPQLLMPIFKRLDKIFPSFDAYLEYARQSPQNIIWDPVMTTYYRADVRDLPGGAVTPYPNLTKMIKVSIGVSNQPWFAIFSAISQPTILINGPENYNLNEPLLPDFKAKEAVKLLQDGQYFKVDGNHHTMLYGNGAKQIVQHITSFIKEPVSEMA
jgi:pimeloyl-ACP methyl ester carboxylesterase